MKKETKEPDLSLIKKEHVCKVVKGYKSGDEGKSESKTTFLLHEKKELPAKYIVREAYKLATGKKLTYKEHIGGDCVAKPLLELKFEVIKKVKLTKLEHLKLLSKIKHDKNNKL